MANNTRFQIIAEALGFNKANTKVKGLTGSMKTMAAGLATAATAYRAMGVAIDSVQLASKLEGVEAGFNNLRKEAGFSANAFNKFDDALDGTVDKLTLMEQANNAMLLGIADSEEQMADMFDVAQRLAKIVGEDATFGVESLVTGLGRQSKLMLDNLGIMIDTNGAYEKYAEELGKTVEQLTDAEKKQGFINEAMAQGKDLVDKAGEEFMTTADKLNQFTTSMTNFKISLGEAIIDTGVLTPIKMFSDAVTGLIEINKKANDPLDTYAEKLLTVRQTLELLNEKVGESDEGFLGFIGQGDTLFANMGNLQEVTDSLTNSQKEFLMSLLGIDNELLLARTIFEDFTLMREDGFLTLSALEQAEINYSTQMERQNSIMEQMNDLSEKAKVNKEDILVVDDKGIKIKKIELDQKTKEILKQQELNKKNKEAIELGIAQGQQFKSLADLATNASRKLVRAKLQEAISTYMAQITPFFSFMGPFAAPAITAASAILSTALEEQIQKISFAEGGMVGGLPHSQGGTPIVAEQGEYVIRKDAVESIGVETLDTINQGGGGGSSIIINNPIISSDFVESELPELISEAIRRGRDFGMS